MAPDCLSGLNLLSEIAVKCCCDVLMCCAIEVLVELKIQKSKGLLGDLEKCNFIPNKKRRSVINRSRRIQLSTFLPITSNNKRFKNQKTRTDLLPFMVPKKKRWNLDSDKKMKRKRQDDEIQFHGVKKQKTTTSLTSSMPIPLWTVQRKSPLRFSLIRLHLSARTAIAV